jgi:hypothetical protein
MVTKISRDIIFYTTGCTTMFWILNSFGKSNGESSNGMNIPIGYLVGQLKAPFSRVIIQNR